MRKCSLALVLLLILAVFFGCTGEVQIADGVYRAEYSDYDQQGYKEFVEITFQDGAVSDVSFDAVSSADGSLKSQSSDIKTLMQASAGTYPEKYYEDLINQYLQEPHADSVDIVAGATASTKSFIALAKALETAIRSGYDGTVIVERA